MDSSIQIEGLSPRQCLFADIMWKLNGEDQVYGFIRSLPAEFQDEAETVMNMMVASLFDAADDTELADQLLLKYRTGKGQ